MLHQQTEVPVIRTNRCRLTHCEIQQNLLFYSPADRFLYGRKIPIVRDPTSKFHIIAMVTRCKRAQTIVTSDTISSLSVRTRSNTSCLQVAQWTCCVKKLSSTASRNSLLSMDVPGMLCLVDQSMSGKLKKSPMSTKCLFSLSRIRSLSCYAVSSTNIQTDVVL